MEAEACFLQTRNEGQMKSSMTRSPQHSAQFRLVVMDFIRFGKGLLLNSRPFQLDLNWNTL